MTTSWRCMFDGGLIYDKVVGSSAVEAAERYARTFANGVGDDDEVTVIVLDADADADDDADPRYTAVDVRFSVTVDAHCIATRREQP